RQRITALSASPLDHAYCGTRRLLLSGLDLRNRRPRTGTTARPRVARLDRLRWPIPADRVCGPAPPLRIVRTVRPAPVAASRTTALRRLGHLPLLGSGSAEGSCAFS